MPSADVEGFAFLFVFQFQALSHASLIPQKWLCPAVHCTRCGRYHTWSDRTIGHRETILIHLTKVTIKDFKSKYRHFKLLKSLERNLQSVIKSSSTVQKNFVLFIERENKPRFCTILPLILEFIYSIKLLLIFVSPDYT